MIGTEITPIPGHPNIGLTRDGRIFRLSHNKGGRNPYGKRPLPYELKAVYVGGKEKRYKAITIETGEKLLLARAMLETFVGFSNSRVIFKDGDRFNCSIENLEWK